MTKNRKPMKPTKAWARIEEDGSLYSDEVFTTKRDAMRANITLRKLFGLPPKRIVRVDIREIVK